MNRSLWQETLSKTTAPAWPCPVCKKGTTALVQKSVECQETIESTRAHDAEEWDPDWITYSFTAWAECRHPACKQRFAISGSGGVQQEYIDDQGGTEWKSYFSPKRCDPMPQMIAIPTKCPEIVVKELEAAFALFWSHRASCAGRIRVALESLMDHVGVPRRKKNKEGKFYEPTLHARIEIYAKNDPASGSQLMALKWLGNSGSHDDEVSEKDLLDAFVILEHALVEIIEQRSAKVAELAKELTKKHRGKH